MTSLSEMIANDAKVIEESKRRSAEKKEWRNELKILGEKRVTEIREEFLPLVGKEGYHFSLESSLKWIEYEKGDYQIFKRNFRKRFIKQNPYFREAESEEDLSGKYIERIINKTNGEKEIYFSADGFKQFCSSAKTEKANAVREYFVRIEREYVDAIHASPEENKMKVGEYNQIIFEHQKQIAEFFMGKHGISESDSLVARGETNLSESISYLLNKFAKSENDRNSFERQVADSQFELRQNEIRRNDLERQFLPDGSDDSYKRIVNAKLREKEFPFVIEIYQISTSTANKWIRAKLQKKKTPQEQKSIIDSDSEIETESVASINVSGCSDYELLKDLLSNLEYVSAEDLSDEDLGEVSHSSQLGYYSIQSFGKGSPSLYQKDKKKINDWLENESKGLNKKKQKPVVEFRLCPEVIRVANKAHYMAILDNIGVIRTTRGKNKIYHTTIDDILGAVDMTYVDILNPPASSKEPTYECVKTYSIPKPPLVGSAHLAERRAERESKKLTYMR